jgi:hypothetical protein
MNILFIILFLFVSLGIQMPLLLLKEFLLKSSGREFTSKNLKNFISVIIINSILITILTQFLYDKHSTISMLVGMLDYAILIFLTIKIK